MSSKSDQIAADSVYVDRALMCSAAGCPNRWSVDAGGGRLCSAHAWASHHEWPSITNEQLDAETQRAIDAQTPREAQRFVKPDPVKLSRYLAKLAAGIRDAQRDPRGWARALRERQEAGERLTQAQIDMLAGRVSLFAGEER